MITLFPDTNFAFWCLLGALSDPVSHVFMNLHKIISYMRGKATILEKNVNLPPFSWVTEQLRHS